MPRTAIAGTVEFKTPADSNLFGLRFAYLEGAGFEFWDVIHDSQDVPEGVMFHCRTEGSVFYNEGVDLYSNGEVVQYHNTPGKKPVFKFGNFEI